MRSMTGSLSKRQLEIMKTYVGLWDALFGVRTTMEFPSSTGGMKRVSVTMKWLEQMQRERKITPISQPMVRVNIFDNRSGLTPEQIEEMEPTQLMDTWLERSPFIVEHWTVGIEVPEEMHRKFLDPETEELYAIRQYENGEPRVCLVRRDVWKAIRKV